MKHFGGFLRSLVPILCGIAFLAAAGVTLAKGKEWFTFENCRLVPNDSNDGDSFHVLTNDTEYFVRLYFVDAPEVKGLGPERLIEQAQYFGVSVPQVIDIGQKAKSLVDTGLAQPFTVITRMAEGLGRSKVPRYYALVRAKDGDLGELLVANGLARIHGTRGMPSGDRSVADEVAELERLEREAKEKKLGAWAFATPAPAGSPGAAPSVSPIISSIRPLATPAASITAKAAPPAAASSLTASTGHGPATKLDVNTATKEQLEHIPGIGSTLAERIIEARPFKSADDLKKIKGVGDGKRYAEIRPFFN